MSRSRAVSPAVAIAALALCALASLALTAPRAEAAKAKCGATFQVLHNDRIGELKLPAGPYDITLINPQRITCAKASKLFSKFLQDFDGNLPGRWKLNVQKARFKKGNRGFQVAPASGGNGGGGQHPGNLSTKCPTFRVLHNDVIDRVRFPAGTYAMTAYGTMSCSAASKQFASFLQNNQNSLPRGWRLNARNGRFVHGPSSEGFQVNLRR
jgi:hypothetical protein